MKFSLFRIFCTTNVTPVHAPACGPSTKQLTDMKQLARLNGRAEYWLNECK